MVQVLFILIVLRFQLQEMTPDTDQALIQKLLAQIDSLKKQIAAILGANGVQAPNQSNVCANNE